MTPRGPRGKRTVGSGSLLPARPISEYPPQSAPAPLHRAPAPGRPHSSSVTLTFDLQLQEGNPYL